MIFETKRLYTRPWRESDIDAAIALWGNPEVTHFIDVRDQLTEEEVREKLLEQIQMQQKYGVQYWALVLKETDQIIGCCGLRPYSQEKNIYELGFHIIPNYWRKGYAVEAALGAIHYAFETLQARELFAGHHPKNTASKYLLEKLGFQYVRDEYYPATGLEHPSYILENPDFSAEKIRKVELRPYDTNWETLFEDERVAIKNILGSNCVEVHHIGSTSIPNIYAKPIIDILPVVTDLSEMDKHNKDFEKLGYQCMGEYGIPGRRFYWKRKAHRSHHIHLFEAGNTEIDRHLAFRDYLRLHHEVAMAYSEIKRDLAEQFENDIVSYVDGKSSFVKYIDYVTGHPQQDQLSATDEVRLEAYNPNWPRLAKAEIATIKKIVDLPFSDIQHLGSTAIDGMLAKPVIDIFIAVDSIAQANNWIKPLESMGYVFWAENPNKQHLRFFKGMPPYGTRRTHHVHIMEKGEKFEKRVKFRDILTSSADLCEQYKQLKQDLSIKYRYDREAYTAKKAIFIKQVLGSEYIK